MADSGSGMNLKYLVIPASKEVIKDHRIMPKRLRNQAEEPIGQRLYNFSTKFKKKKKKERTQFFTIGIEFSVLSHGSSEDLHGHSLCYVVPGKNLDLSCLSFLI